MIQGRMERVCIGSIRRKRQKGTSCDLEVCATKPPPWKCNTSHGEGGLRFVFRPNERDIWPPSERHSANNFSLSWRHKWTISTITMESNIIKIVKDYFITTQLPEQSLFWIHLKLYAPHKGKSSHLDKRRVIKRYGRAVLKHIYATAGSIWVQRVSSKVK